MAATTLRGADAHRTDQWAGVGLTPPPQLPLAPLWRRAAARLVDAAVVFFVLWVAVVLHVLWFMGSLSSSVDPQPWGRAFVPTVAFVALFAVYEVVYLAYNRGQTPGKELLKVRVVRCRDQGDPGLAQTAARSVLPVGIWLTSPVWLALALLFLPGTTALLGPRRSAWHDRLTGTAVVQYDRRADEEGEET